MKKVGVIILCINLYQKYTRPIVEQLINNRAIRSLDYEIYVVDNGSTDETQRELSDRLGVHYMKNFVNIGCSGGWNQGIDHAKMDGCELFFIINNDVLLHPECIEKLSSRLEKGDNTVMATGCDVRGDFQDNIQGMLNINCANREYIQESEHPNFSAFMVTKEGYDKIGKFDEAFFPAYFEDNDYHYRMKILDFKAVCLPTAVFYHYGSKTQNEAIGKPVVSSAMFLKNQQYYINKWGGTPSNEQYKKPFNA